MMSGVWAMAILADTMKEVFIKKPSVEEIRCANLGNQEAADEDERRFT
jgi:hypothetical protein